MYTQEFVSQYKVEAIMQLDFTQNLKWVENCVVGQHRSHF